MQNTCMFLALLLSYQQQASLTNIIIITVYFNKNMVRDIHN